MLSALRGLTARGLLKLAARERSASACLSAIRNGVAGSPSDQAFARGLDPAEIEVSLAACGARLVAAGSSEYPNRLTNLADPPAAVFVRGRPLSEAAPAVSVVGARNCTSLGRDVARDIGRRLAGAGVCVVSGAARGIDSAAHQGALDADGPTVAVLGCGIDVSYPRASGSMIDRIARVGAVVSEYPPGVPAEPFRFPARNRIVAALGEALVVVEGAAGSGSLISADHALEIGRPVFAVAGAVNNPLAEVPLALIREGACMIRGADDLLADLEVAGAAASGTGARRANVTVPEEMALELVAGPVLPEVVARGLGLSLPEVIPLLMSLELKGLVRSVGGRFERRLPERP